MLTNGQLDQAAGPTMKTLRDYERIGLLPKARREGGGGFRRYDCDDLMALGEPGPGWTRNRK